MSVSVGRTRRVQKMHAVSWKKLCGPKDHGGMGIKSLKPMNEAIMIKMLWKISKNPNDLWVQVLLGKYHRRQGGEPDMCDKAGDSRLWKELVKMKELFRENITMKIQDRSETRVWLDNWVNEEGKLSKFLPSRDSVDRDLKVKELVLCLKRFYGRFMICHNHWKEQILISVSGSQKVVGNFQLLAHTNGYWELGRMMKKEYGGRYGNSNCLKEYEFLCGRLCIKDYLPKT